MNNRVAYTPVYTAQQEQTFSDQLWKHRGLIYAAMKEFRFIKDHERDDYFQEAAIYAWRRYHLFDRTLGSFAGWLFKTAVWGMAHYRRDIRKDADFTVYNDRIESWYDVADEIYNESHIEYLKQAIEELPSEDRKYIDQFLTGGTRAEIISDMGVSVKNYETRMNQIRKTIRNNRHKYFDNIWVDPKKFETGTNSRKNELHPDSKPVIMLSLEGRFIKRFPSTGECERQGFSRDVIMNVCNGLGWTHKGYRWMYEGETRPEILEKLKAKPRKRGEGQKCKAVNQYDIWGTFIRTFNSMAEAERSGYNLSNIKNFKQGEMRRCQGYLWALPESD